VPPSLGALKGSYSSLFKEFAIESFVDIEDELVNFSKDILL
jgi:hypothetical protein